MCAQRLGIAVIGLGSAGGAASALLARAGHQVRLYERVPEPGAVGAGIVLQPTGMAALAALGLAGAVVARGARLDRLRCVTTSGREVVHLAYRVLGEDLYGVGLHRGVLFERLAQAVRDAGVALVTGCDVVALPRGRGGRWVVDAGGGRHGPFDLVVVADGARSRLAAQVNPGRRAVTYPWGALWFVGVDHERRFAGSGELFQVVRGAQRMLGLLPTGLGPTSRDLDGRAEAELPLVSLYWSLRASAYDDWRRAGLGPWKAEILAAVPDAAPLLAQIHDVDQVLLSAYQDVTMWPWDDGDAVVLGDAAHATSPQLGQGANLALWDAMILAQLLAEAPSVREALDAYSRARRGHLDWFQLATRWLTPFFQGDSRLLGWLRDLAMPVAAKLPLVERLMIASMCGTAMGPLAAPLALPARPPRLPLKGASSG
jgi:2-polyprenyl-6-methoxyphenol hydroxylase-like FAD-dependent oxidoreductase